MRTRSISLGLCYVITGIGAIAVSLAPVPISYAFLISAAGCVGLLWDVKSRHPLPRSFLTMVGAAGFFFSLLPLNRETLAEQSLSALAILMAVKLLGPKKRRDHLQILTLSVMMVSGGATLSPDLIFGLLFLASLFAGVLLLLWLPFAELHDVGFMEYKLMRRLGSLTVIITLGAIPLAVVIFSILPRALNPFWSGFSPSRRAVSGFSDQIHLGEIGKMALSYEVAFRAQVEDPPGPLNQTPYWRGIVLEETDGKRWTKLINQSQSVGIRGPSSVRIIYYVEPHGEREIFVLEQPVSVSTGFRIVPVGADRVVRLHRPLLRPARYRGLSNPSEVLYEPITGETRDRNVALPETISPRIRELAVGLMGDETEAENIANRMMIYLKNNFTYSLETPSGGDDPLVDFLMNTRTGYCEYFASAMAIMLRVVGIPARLVAGYLGGEYNETGRYYLVRQAEAHTWVEAYIEGRGWVRLDPTPGAGDLGGTLASRRSSRPRLWLDTLRMRWNSWVVQYDTEVQVQLLGKAKQEIERIVNTRLRYLALAVVPSLLGIMVVLWIGLKLARRSTSDPLEKCYRRFRRLMIRKGYDRPLHEGPMDHAQRIASARPDAARMVIEFAHSYSRFRYGCFPVTGQDIDRMRAMLKAISKTMSRRISAYEGTRPHASDAASPINPDRDRPDEILSSEETE